MKKGFGLIFLVILLLSLSLLVGCNTTKVDSQTLSGGGSASAGTGYTCVDNTDGTKTCYPTSTASGTGGTGTTTTRVDSGTSLK